MGFVHQGLHNQITEFPSGRSRCVARRGSIVLNVVKTRASPESQGSSLFCSFLSGLLIPPKLNNPRVPSLPLTLTYPVCKPVFSSSRRSARTFPITCLSPQSLRPKNPERPKARLPCAPSQAATLAGFVAKYVLDAQQPPRQSLNNVSFRNATKNPTRTITARPVFVSVSNVLVLAQSGLNGSG